MPYRFVTPTVQEAPAGFGPLFYRVELSRGVSVLKVDGTYTDVRYPSQTELEEADAYYLGGHEYEVSDAVAAELTAAGYGEYLTEI